MCNKCFQLLLHTYLSLFLRRLTYSGASVKNPWAISHSGGRPIRDDVMFQTVSFFYFSYQFDTSKEREREPRSLKSKLTLSLSTACEINQCGFKSVRKNIECWEWNWSKLQRNRKKVRDKQNRKSSGASECVNLLKRGTLPIDTSFSFLCFLDLFLLFPSGLQV